MLYLQSFNYCEIMWCLYMFILGMTWNENIIKQAPVVGVGQTTFLGIKGCYVMKKQLLFTILRGGQDLKCENSHFFLIISNEPFPYVQWPIVSRVQCPMTNLFLNNFFLSEHPQLELDSKAPLVNFIYTLYIL